MTTAGTNISDLIVAVVATQAAIAAADRLGARNQGAWSTADQYRDAAGARYELAKALGDPTLEARLRDALRTSEVPA